MNVSKLATEVWGYSDWKGVPLERLERFAALVRAEALAEQEISGKHTCLSEKQEPVAWVDLTDADKLELQSFWRSHKGQDLTDFEVTSIVADSVTTAFKSKNAATVSAEPCKECGAKQAQIDRLMLEYCPDEMTHEQMQEWEKNIKPFVEPENQESVAVISESAIGLVKLHSNGVSLPFGTPLYAAPVDAKAIRAEALEYAAYICDGIARDDSGFVAEDCANAIRSLK